MADRRPLSANDVDAALTALPDWRGSTGDLHAGFTAGTVAGALALIAVIGVLAEELDHHPDVDWRYRQVFVRSSTHSAGGRVTALDVALAARISAEALRLGVTPENGVMPEKGGPPRNMAQ